MKRIKSFCARGIAIILSALILSCTVISDFEKPVYAMGMEDTLYFGLRALMQSVMLSMGYSYSSTSDLDISTKGLENVIQSYKDTSSFSDAVTLTGLFKWVSEKKIGDTLDNVTDHLGAITYVKQYIQNQMAGKSSYESSSDKTAIKTSVTRVSSVTDAMKRSNFKGLDCNLKFSSGLSNCNVYASYSQEPNAYNSNNGFSVTYFCAYSNGALVLNNNTLTLYNSDSSSPVPFHGNRLDKRFLSDTTLTSYWQDNWTYTYEKDVSYSLDLSKFTSVYSSLPVYSSYDAYVKSVENSQTYKIKNRIVGDTANAKDLSSSISVTDDSATKKVQTAVEAAQASGTTLTDAQIDEIAAKVVQSINTTNTNTSDTPVDMTDTNSLINNVNISIKTLTDLITKYQQKYIDGSSALQNDVDDISDQFKIVNGNNNQENPDPENDPKVWIPPGFFAISFLKPLMEYFSEPISEITKFLNKITNSVASLPQLFDEKGKLYLGNIFTDISSITSNVGQIAQSIGSLPSAIGDVIEIPQIKPKEIVDAFNSELVWPDIKVEVPTINIPEIKVPDIKIPEIQLPAINFPEIPNPLAILEQILSAIQNLFVIDTVAIGEAASGLQKVWDNHLPFIPKLKNCFSNLKFSNSYDYPVIKIQTPAILLNFYSKEYIVLLDFKDYAYYFLWARNIVRAMLWVGFAYSIFKHFRVRFHIG